MVGPASRRVPRGGRISYVFQRLLVIVSVAVAVNALAGERGILEMRRAARQHQVLVAAVASLRQQNAALEEQARQLRHDPTRIEQLARQELGLIRRGEIVVIVKNVRAAKAGR